MRLSVGGAAALRLGGCRAIPAFAPPSTLARWWLPALAAAVLCGCRTTITLAPQPERLLDPRDALIRDLGNDMRRLLCEAGAIDAVTQRENRPARLAQQRRQRELDLWFDRHNRNVSLEDCRTPEDRANYRDFPWVMANVDFLKLPYRQRLRYLERIATWFAHAQDRFGISLDRLTGDDPWLRQALAARAQQVPVFRARYFGRQALTAHGAVYLPEQQVILVNLNLLAQWPEEFIDSFEHELWHHLLPITDTAHISRQPWTEGFVEAVSELWSEELRAAEVLLHPRELTVEYPLQSAWASLCLGMDAQATLRHLAGLDDRAAFASRLAASPTPLGPSLALQVEQSDAIPPSRLARLNRLLNQWGWKEDDGSPMDITRYVARDRLDAAAIDREFLEDKPFVLDLVRAMTVTSLQDLQQQVPADRIQQSVHLPTHLADNLARVLAYARDPAVDFSHH